MTHAADINSQISRHSTWKWVEQQVSTGGLSCDNCNKSTLSPSGSKWVWTKTRERVREETDRGGVEGRGGLGPEEQTERERGKEEKAQTWNGATLVESKPTLHLNKESQGHKWESDTHEHGGERMRKGKRRESHKHCDRSNRADIWPTVDYG